MKETLQYATCMNLEDITLSETSQSKEDKYCMIHLHKVFTVKIIETEKFNRSCQGLGREWRVII